MLAISRRDALKTIAAAALIGGGISARVRAALADEARPVRSGFHRIAGEVRVNGDLARAGTAVQPGDSVTTGPGAEAVYVIGQDAFLQRESSVVRFGADATKDFFRVLSGKILSVFGAGQKALLTPTATLGIRGTGCYIEVSPKTTYFCLCYGVAEVVPAADPSRGVVYETGHHEHPILLHHDVGMPAMVDAPMVNHTDTELTLLEAIVGRKPPFYGKPMPAMGGDRSVSYSVR